MIHSTAFSILLPNLYMYIYLALIVPQQNVQVTSVAICTNATSYRRGCWLLGFQSRLILVFPLTLVHSAVFLDLIYIQFPFRIIDFSHHLRMQLWTVFRYNDIWKCPLCNLQWCQQRDVTVVWAVLSEGLTVMSSNMAFQTWSWCTDISSDRHVVREHVFSAAGTMLKGTRTVLKQITSLDSNYTNSFLDKYFL